MQVNLNTQHQIKPTKEFPTDGKPYEKDDGSVFTPPEPEDPMEGRFLAYEIGNQFLEKYTDADKFSTDEIIMDVFDTVTANEKVYDYNIGAIMYSIISHTDNAEYAEELTQDYNNFAREYDEQLVQDGHNDNKFFLPEIVTNEDGRTVLVNRYDNHPTSYPSLGDAPKPVYNPD